MFRRLSLCVLLVGMSFGIASGQAEVPAEGASGIEEIWRSSDQPGEVSTSRRKRRRAYGLPEPPPGAFRLGCICMDGTRADTRGIGSCSGHGGVRYWVYRKREGDTLHLPTERHMRHPEALPAEQMMALSRRREDRIRRMAEGRGGAELVVAPAAEWTQAEPVADGGEGGSAPIAWLDAAGVAAAGASLYLVVRAMLRWSSNNPELAKYALRHLLRYRKRPKARARRPGARKKRLP